MAVLIFGYQWYQNREGRDGVPVRPTPQLPQASATGAEPATDKPSVSKPTASTSTSPRPNAAATKRPSLTRNVVLRDQDGDVIYRGEIDLGPSLERIAAARKLRFPNDGSTFQNREGRLPRKPSGYYTEWVVPTPGESGPGPQRIVLGDDGDVWYTRDHYKNFERIPGGLPAAEPAGAR
ncbi:MAG: ribonuclease [Planctomycetes bacterium]|nr:ribonuclease [Planctomycetota bacterium]